MAGNILSSTKESLLCRYNEEARVVCIGNYDIAAGWIRHGRGLLGDLRNKLSLGGIDSGNRKAIMPDGTEIMVFFNGTINGIIVDSRKVVKPSEVTLCPMYEESGLLAFDFTSPSLYRNINGATYYSYEDDEYNPPLDDALISKLLLILEDHPDDGEKSKTIRRPLQEEYGNTSPDPAIEAALDAEAYLVYNWVKYAMRLSPSMYSGKVQLLIESKIGHKNALAWVEAHDPVLDGSYGFPYYTIHNKRLDFNVVDCCGIFTVPTYKGYYLIELGSNMRATRIILSYCGDLIRQHLAKNPDKYSRVDRNKLESLILSTANFSTSYALEDLGSVSVSSYPVGQYGWHFNWQGNQADIVTIDTTYELDEEDSRFIGRHYRITFFYNEDFDENPDEELPVGYRIELIEESAFRKAQRSRIMYHEYFFYRAMVRWDHWTASPLYAADATNDGPVYCFYDNEDKINIVRYKHEFSTGVPCPSLDVPGGVGGPYWWHCEYPYYKEFLVPETSCGTTYEQGFYLTVDGEADTTSVISYGTNRVYRFAYMQSLPPDPVPLPSAELSGVECHPSYPWGACTISDGYGSGRCPDLSTWPAECALSSALTAHYRYLYTNRRELDDLGIVTVLLMIPEFDCDGVFLVKREANSTDLVKFGEGVPTPSDILQFVYQADNYELFYREDGVQCTRWNGYHLFAVRADYWSAWIGEGPYTSETYSRVGAYYASKNCGLVELIPWEEEDLEPGNPFLEAVSVTEAYELPLDSFNMRCKRGLHDDEAVMTGPDEEDDYTHYITNYPEWRDTGYIANVYVGWA